MAEGVTTGSGVVAIGSSGFGSPNLASDGVVGAPTYTFASSPTSGMWLRAANNVGMAISGVDAYFWNSVAFGSIGTGIHDLGTAAASWKRVYIDFTNTGTVGAVTINKAAGRVNIAAAGSSVVVTNSLVTAASKVFCVISTADATAVLKNVVPAAGSFTITLNAATTAQTSIDFFVVNSD